MRESPQNRYLFLDLRHIRCGDLEWHSPEGKAVPLVNPPEPQVELHARPALLARGVRLVAQPARKTDPIEGLPRQVIFEEGRYRAWTLNPRYPPGQDFGCASKAYTDSATVHYVESKDGFDWKEVGRRAVSIPRATGIDGCAFFVDPKAPAEERYKLIYMAVPPEAERKALWQEYSKVHPRHRDVRLRPGYVCCIYSLVSPDGLRWKALPRPLMIHKSDTDTTVYYDYRLDRYVMYTRLYWQDRRWIARAEAADFRQWGPVSPLIWPRLDGPLTDDIYTNARTAYPGLPTYHLMFPAIYHRSTQTSDVRLYSSADGICWNEVPGGPVISPGDPGSWDSAYITAGKDLVPLGKDRVGIPYSGTCFPHKYPRWKKVLESQRVGWAWWPERRLCGVVADEEGEFFTPELIPTGRRLRLNIRATGNGQVRVGILRRPNGSRGDSTLVASDAFPGPLAPVAGRSAADCDPVTGDDPAALVRWKGDAGLATATTAPVVLHFRLRKAEMFSFEFE